MSDVIRSIEQVQLFIYIYILLFRGTTKYCSAHANNRGEQGRPDDLWSMIYVLAEMRGVSFLPCHPTTISTIFSLFHGINSVISMKFVESRWLPVMKNFLLDVHLNFLKLQNIFMNFPTSSDQIMLRFIKFLM